MNRLDVKLLELLHRDGFVSGEVMSRELGVSRTTIWKHMSQLKKQGYQIESVPSKGYHLLNTPDRLLPEEIYLGLKSGTVDIIGREIKYYPVVSSTNKQARELIGEVPMGTVVIAGEQTGGRGRLGRSWYSPPGTGLWFSLIIAPDISPRRAPFLTITASLAVFTVLQQIVPIGEVELKWPNDILIRGKKVCGILSELSAEMDSVKYAIIGIGLNVNHDGFPTELQDSAISLKQVTGASIQRTSLLQHLLNSFSDYYRQLRAGQYQQLIDKWEGCLDIIGCRVTVSSGRESYQGQVVDISSMGELIMEDEQGKVHRFWAGDVTLRRKKTD